MFLIYLKCTGASAGEGGARKVAPQPAMPQHYRVLAEFNVCIMQNAL
jgi:hypothetical protein